MGNYPGSVDSAIRATIYGSLPDHGRTTVALVMHTTETRGMPGYKSGDTAPHYSYSPKYRTFYQHAEFEDGYVGTLRGHTKGGHGNCKAFQLEILCYSDKEYADLYSGIWVGEFTDEHYQDLADFTAWAREEYGITSEVYAAPDTGWLPGSASWLRLTGSEWDDFGGLTAHGAVPVNTHWDTGVLDLERISQQEEDMTYIQFCNEWIQQVSDEDLQRMEAANLFNGVWQDWAAVRDVGLVERDTEQRRQVARLRTASEIGGWASASEQETS